MSEIFDGVVVKCSPDALRPLTAGLGCEFVCEPFGDGGVAYPLSTRNDPSAAKTTALLVQSASQSFGEALLIQYDSRCGYRRATLFRNGVVVREFTPDDEIWVPTYENGKPMPGPWLTVHQLVEGEEYETAINAIELGLSALGCGSWEELKAIISSQ